MGNAKTRIRFWGGLRTIGGTVITIESGGARLVFDFGRIPSPRASWFGGVFSVREGRTVHDALRLKLLPKIDGLYHKKQLRGIDDVLPYEDFPGRTEVYISHLHLDHTGAMDAIAREIPVYMTPESLRLEQVLERAGEGFPIARRYSALEPGRPHELGAMTITPLRVDHDVIGASGLHIQTPDGSIVYTGDLRLHGLHPEVTEEFLHQAKWRGFQLLIMETTRLSGSDDLSGAPYMTEKELAARWEALAAQTQGLVLFNVYNRHVERLHTVVEIARRTGRRIVFDAPTSQVLHAFFPDDRADVMSSGTPDADHLLARINADPGHYMMQCACADSLELLDVNLREAVYIHAGGMPLGDYDPAYRQLLDFLEFIGLKYVPLNCSGHASPEQLKQLLGRLDPDVLVPVHGLHPERLMPVRGRQFLPEYGRYYDLPEIIGGTGGISS